MPSIVTRQDEPPIPEGTYAAVVRGCRDTIPPWGAPSSEVHFEICETPHSGKLVTGLVSKTLDERSKLSGWLRGLGVILPTDPNVEVKFDLESLIGRPCVVQLKHNVAKKSGKVYSRVEQIYAMVNYSPRGQLVQPVGTPIPAPIAPQQSFGAPQGFQPQPRTFAPPPAGFGPPAAPAAFAQPAVAFPPAPVAFPPPAAPLAAQPPAAQTLQLPPVAPFPATAPAPTAPAQARPPFAGSVKFD